MIRTTLVCTAAGVLLAACAHATTSTGSATRGEPVGVNSYSYSTATIDTTPVASSSTTTVQGKSAPVTGSVTGSIQPTPSAMATTTSSGNSR